MPVSPPWSHLPPAHCRCRSVTAVVAPRPERPRGSVLAENRSDVATSIDHPHDLNLLARDPVEQDGRVYDDFTNAGFKIIAIASHERRSSQAHRGAMDVTNMLIREGGRKPRCAPSPDREKIVFGFGGPNDAKATAHYVLR